MRLHALLAAPVIALALAACTESKPAADVSTEAESKMSDRLVSLEQTISDMEASAVALHETPGPAVYFVNLHDGMTVPQSFRVVFGAYGIGVAPALTDKPDTGHHHLLIDTTLTDEEKQFAIPKDDKHMHFGGGQTEVVLQLSTGPHTLQLVFGDMNHELHKPTAIMSDKITVNVQ
jgi:hypothetical protein